jgi:hypothetical protein
MLEIAIFVPGDGNSGPVGGRSPAHGVRLNARGQ